MSANTRAPSTIVTIALTGQTEFNIPFEYLARKYVEVTLLGINRLPLVLNTDFRFVTKTLISLTRPYTADYTQIELRRVTSATERLVDFHDGSILRAYDLNLSQIQTLHVAEEARDLTADTIGVNDEGHLDARNRKIVNLAYAENGGDAIPFGQVVAWNDSAYNSMVRAEAAQAVTEASTAIAVKAKNDARDSELSAQVSAGGSAASAQTAVDARNDTLSAQADVTTKHDTVVAKHGEVMQVVPKLDDAVSMMTGLGNVPVGVIAMVMTPVVTAGWVRCGEAFDKGTYPALAKLYPSGVVPSFDERYAKGVSRADAGKLGTTGESGIGSVMEPNHTNVWFIIKAAEGVADKDEAMQVVGTIVGRVDTAEAEIAQLRAKVSILEANAAKAPSFCAMSHVDVGTWVYPQDGYVWQLGSGGRIDTVGEADNDDFRMQATDQPRVFIKEDGLYEIQYTQLGGGQDSALKQRSITLGVYSGESNIGTIAMAGGASASHSADVLTAVFPAKAGDQIRLTAGNNAYYGSGGHNRFMCRRVG